jgi:nucleoid DNA-binding protein
MADKKTAKPVKKAIAKKTIAKATPKAAPAKKVNLSVKEAFPKSKIIAFLCESTELKKRDVVNVLEGLEKLISAHLDKRGPGEFNLPGLLKCRVIRKPATKARKGVNPFTGEPTTFKAKPARNIVKIRPLKKLKEMVA